jgi:hypothetical protein
MNFIAWGLTTLALLAGCASAPVEPGHTIINQAWIQHSADQGLLVRATTSASVCPDLRFDDGAPQRMSLRTGPAVLPARVSSAQPDAKPAVFELLSCEAALRPGSTRIEVGTTRLTPPRNEIRRIVLIGDTGCRMKASDQAFQGCNDATDWPFAAVARSAAAKNPDLVIHVGDVHYRESPCPADHPGCSGSPWGYGDDAWRADFFVPAAPLLAAAPWLFIRGNHESCNRAGQGWFRYLDGRAWSATSSCNDPEQDGVGDFSAPFAVPVAVDTQFIVFDSSRTGGKAYGRSDPAFAIYSAQFETVAALARQKPHSIFFNHHPVLAFAPGPTADDPRPGNGGLYSVLAARDPQRLFAPGIDTVINGHVHLFEALGFASDHPSNLVVGNAGSEMSGNIAPAAALKSQPAPGARVETFATQDGFGFATLDRVDPAGWRLTEWSVAGKALQVCDLVGAQLHCR